MNLLSGQFCIFTRIICSLLDAKSIFSASNQLILFLLFFFQVEKNHCNNSYSLFIHFSHTILLQSRHFSNNERMKTKCVFLFSVQYRVQRSSGYNINFSVEKYIIYAINKNSVSLFLSFYIINAFNFSRFEGYRIN